MGNLMNVAAALRELATIVEEMVEGEEGPPWINRVAEMPVNEDPFQVDFVRNFWGNGSWPMWPTRDLEAVTGLTVHHTLSHSPVATAQYCAFTKGYPTVQYHWWVAADDGCAVYQLALPEWGIWHDHTGAYPSTLSIGMAGRWDMHRPSAEQIGATAGLCRYLMGMYGIPVGEVRGHLERFKGTVCPGWNMAGWRDDFYGVL